MCVLNARRTLLIARSVQTKNLIITLNITISIRENLCPITNMHLQFTNTDLQIKNQSPLTSVTQELTFRISEHP
jgi:hypothetical protein